MHHRRGVRLFRGGVLSVLARVFGSIPVPLVAWVLGIMLADVLARYTPVGFAEAVGVGALLVACIAYGRTFGP